MSTATFKCFKNRISIKSNAFVCPPSYCWIKKKNLFIPKVINCDIVPIGKAVENNGKKATVCLVFCMNFTFSLIWDLCYALSRQKTINTYKICLSRSFTPWWKAFTSQPLYKWWALLLSISFLYTFNEENYLIICSNEPAWRHKQKESLFEGLTFPHTLGT